MNEIKDQDVLAIAQLIENQAQTRTHEDGTPYLVLRLDQKIEDVERLLPFPVRRKGTTSLTRCESFIRFVKEHAEESSRIYVAGRTLVAVLNHSDKGQADWGDHRAVYAMSESPQWKLWTASNGKKFNQKDFGQLIEDNLEDIVNPPSTHLLEMVRQFEATSSVEYKSFDRGDNGNFSVQFVQTTQSKVGQKGEVELPRSFTLNIPAFEGGSKDAIMAKLRFSIDGGKLVLWYELQRVQQVIDRHIEAVLALVETETEIKPFYGSV